MRMIRTCATYISFKNAEQFIFCSRHQPDRSKGMRCLLHDLSIYFDGLKTGIISLKRSPCELWKAYALKFLDSYSYFSLSIIFTLFLSHDFGYTDVEAGSLYGVWGAMVTVYGLIAGFIVDNLGVAQSLRLGFCVTLLSRLCIFLTTSRTALLWNVCGALPLGNCLGIPVMTIGIRRYTTTENRGFAFGLFYVIMNVAALLSGPVVDALTIVYDDQKGYGTELTVANYASHDWHLSGYRLVILSGVIANAIAVAISFTLRDVKVTSLPPLLDGSISSSELHAHTVAEFVPIPGTGYSIFKETIQDRRFWRFLVVCLITLNVRMIFRP